jgi:hypothetical protein
MLSWQFLNMFYTVTQLTESSSSFCQNGLPGMDNICGELTQKSGGNSGVADSLLFVMQNFHIGEIWYWTGARLREVLWKK